MYCESDFITIRKWCATKDVDWVLLQVARHVEQGLYRITSISASKHSFVVVCDTEKQLKDLGDAFPFIG